MNNGEWREVIEKLVRDYVKEYPSENGVPELWRVPIVGYADALDPYIQRLPEIVAEGHKLPGDFMEDPKIVISYFVPFVPEVAQTNIHVKDNAASKEWTDAYNTTNTMMARLNEYLAAEITKRGGRAVVPFGVGMKEEILKSDWSQRHLAYAAGLGTFGINNMLISEEGCCGRYNSIVADIPVEPDGHQEEEKCLYKSKGLCKKCVENCFMGALTVEGFDRFKCFEACSKNLRETGADVCGKCNINIPCAFAAPGK